MNVPQHPTACEQVTKVTNVPNALTKVTVIFQNQFPSNIQKTSHKIMDYVLDHLYYQ